MGLFLRSSAIIPILFLLIIPWSLGQQIRIITDESSPDFGSLEVIKLAEIRTAILQVFPKQAWQKNNDDLPPMLGKTFSTDSSLVFVPKYSFIQGKSYMVRLQMPEGTPQIIHEFKVPVLRKAKPTKIVQVYPSSAILPANLLKMYIQFSAPMGQDEVYPNLSLYDDEGQEIVNPFLEIHPPLWDKTQKRLTLWFDPGRIKRGLHPNRELGPPLRPWKTYILKIAPDWKDALGQKLENGFEKSFHVIKADRQKPNPRNWKVDVPPAGTRDPLTIYFPEPMDKALLDSGVGVFEDENRQLLGESQTLDSERQWSFVPQFPWHSGSYAIRLSVRMEDLAGNNLKRLFDQSIIDQKKEQQELYALEFIIR